MSIEIHWDEFEDHLLWKYHRILSSRELQKMLRKSRRAIETRAHHLELYMPSESGLMHNTCIVTWRH